MLRDLFTAENQVNPHHWLTTLLAHTVVGICLWLLFGQLGIFLYLVFELVQALVSRRQLVWDIILDSWAVWMGIEIAGSLWAQNYEQVLWYLGVTLLVGFTGAHQRGK